MPLILCVYWENKMEFSKELIELKEKALQRCQSAFDEAQRIAFITSERVLNAFQEERVRAGYLQ